MSRLVEHPDDTAFLDAQLWTSGWLRNYCDRCDEHHPTVPVGHIEAASGPGYELRFCRTCVALHLARARAAAVRDGFDYLPQLPEVSPT